MSKMPAPKGAGIAACQKSPFGLFEKGRTTLSARTHAPCRAGPMCPAAGYAFFGGARGPRPTGRYVEPRVGDGVLPWSAAEQMSLGYDVPSARRCRAARPPLGGGCRRSRLGERKPCGISPSASASRCHLPRRGRQGETDSHDSVRTGSE